jgi:hypothetical protein
MDVSLRRLTALPDCLDILLQREQHGPTKELKDRRLG